MLTILMTGVGVGGGVGALVGAHVTLYLVFFSIISEHADGERRGPVSL